MVGVSPLISVRNLRYQYDDGTSALNGIDFQLDAGETVAILGANGSGKTTFILHLNGLLMGQGIVEVCGLAVEKKHLPAVRRKVGLVFQDADNQLFMPTVLEDVTFGLQNLGMDSATASVHARAALERTGMLAAANRAPYHLSAGEKKRVAIAGILAMAPEILVLDEPTTFLDPPAQRSLVELLAGLPQAKILVTHNVPFAAALATRAVFFEKGRITAEGPVGHVVAGAGWEFDWHSISRIRERP